MSQLLISIVAFLVAIGLLIFVHEFGHFWVARLFGVKVLRFSIGFGRPLFRWYDKLGTEYVISMIPLGGYVSLFGERGELVSKAERQMSFHDKPVVMRMLVLAAGPVFNLLFAVLAFWMVFLMGSTLIVPILGSVPQHSPAFIAGLRAGEEIVSIEGKATPSWEAVSMQLLSHMGESTPIKLTVRTQEKENLQDKMIDISDLADGKPETDWLAGLGLTPVDPVPATVGKVLKEYPAFKAGIKEGDKILSVDHVPVYSRSQVIEEIQPRAGKNVVLELLRGGKVKKVTVVPLSKFSEETKKNVGFLGIEFLALKELPSGLVRVQDWGVGEALGMAFKRTWDLSLLTLEVFKKMIFGKVSVRHVSGPLSIAKYAGETAAIGLKQFLDFLGMISLSLGVLNLLPIPVLDGGHFMYCVFELLTGRRVSFTAQTIGSWVGGALLVGFMILAFYNDLSFFLLR